MAIGRPKADETGIGIRVTTETAQLLATLATSQGRTTEEYLKDVVIHYHLETQKDNPVLATWYRTKYPLIEAIKVAEPKATTTPKGGKK